MGCKGWFQVYSVLRCSKRMPNVWMRTGSRSDRFRVLLVNGGLSEKAKEGLKVFEKLQCGECHSGPYFTDQKMHRIGENVEFEKGWDTPTLIEVWRTAPYLFDGRAATMQEVFEVHKNMVLIKKYQKRKLKH